MMNRKTGIKKAAKAIRAFFPAVTVFAALFVSGDPLFASCALAAAAIHEVGHILAALYSADRLDLCGERFIAFHVSGGTTDCLISVSITIQILLILAG